MRARHTLTTDGWSGGVTEVGTTVRTLTMPSRAYLRAVSVVASVPLRAVGKIIGTEMIVDTLTFLGAFEGMEAGIRSRAKRVDEMFTEPSTAFLLVVAPRQGAIDEGRFFTQHLGQQGIPVRALIVNRLHPLFDARPASAASVATVGTARTRSGASAQAFTALKGNWAELRAEGESEENYVTALAAQVAPTPVARVPLLDGDVHDLRGVQTVADHLFGLSNASSR